MEGKNGLLPLRDVVVGVGLMIRVNDLNCLGLLVVFIRRTLVPAVQE